MLCKSQVQKRLQPQHGCLPVTLRTGCEALASERQQILRSRGQLAMARLLCLPSSSCACQGALKHDVMLNMHVILRRQSALSEEGRAFRPCRCHEGCV